MNEWLLYIQCFNCFSKIHLLYVYVVETTKHLGIFLMPKKFMSHTLQTIIKIFIMIYSIKKMHNCNCHFLFPSLTLCICTHLHKVMFVFLVIHKGMFVFLVITLHGVSYVLHVHLVLGKKDCLTFLGFRFLSFVSFLPLLWILLQVS